MFDLELKSFYTRVKKKGNLHAINVLPWDRYGAQATHADPDPRARHHQKWPHSRRSPYLLP